MQSREERAKLYQLRAAECLSLARLATAPESRREYEQLAVDYLKLAEEELRLMIEN